MDNKFPLKTGRLIVYNTLFWLTLFLLEMLQHYAYRINANTGETIEGMIGWNGTHYLTLWIMSFIIFAIFLKIRPYIWKKALLIFIPVSILLGFVSLIFFIPMLMGIQSFYTERTMSFWEAMGINFGNFYPLAITFMMKCWIVMIILLAWDFYHQYRHQRVRALELESKLTRSELQALRMQLQPHFLFNALNTIAMMVRQQKGGQAVEMISGLSDLLRNTLQRQGEQWVPLSEELGLIRAYLKIEEARFQDKLTVSFDIQSETLPMSVPNLLLQPIVENAFKYGISRSLDEATISIKSELNGAYIYLSIHNSGPYLPEGWNMHNHLGIGISNTLSRLSQLYGNNFLFNIYNAEPNGVTAELRIPKAI